MKNENPFDKVFDQIADLLAHIQKKTTEKHRAKDKKPPPYEDIEMQLEELEQATNIFQAITDEAIKKSGINEETLQQYIKESPDTLSHSTRQAMERAKQLKKETNKLHTRLEQQAKIAKRIQKGQTSGKKRRKKFKRLGGQGWIPL